MQKNRVPPLFGEGPLLPTQRRIEMTRADILDKLLEERERQDSLWGDQSHHSDAWWNVIASEENGEVAREVYEQNEEKLFAEIVQACAVYFAWAEAIKRRNA